MRSLMRAVRGPLAVVSGLAVAGGLLVVVAPPAQAATFTVTTSNDSGAGSLREAIVNANLSPGSDTIAFDIGDGGPQTIQLSTGVNGIQSLSPITEAVTIDGTTQPGYSGTPLIEIREQAPPSARTALTIASSDVSIWGLSLTGFGTGVKFTAASSASEVRDSYFGMDLAGTAVQGQQLNVGVEVAGGDDNAVLDNQIANAGTGIWVYGSAAPGSPRIISGNRIGIGTSNTNPLPVNEGILLDTSTSAVTVSNNSVVGHSGNTNGIRLQQTGGLISVTGNRIGFGADDSASFPGRVGGGIVLNGATSSPTVNNNQIFGGSGTGLVVNAFSNIMSGGASGNVISGNGGAGISVSGGALARFQIGGNQISENAGLGIDVAPAGVNSVPDGGPTIDSITPGPSGTNSITMTYAGPTSAAGQTVGIYLSRNDECDPSGFGEGATPLGSSFTNRVLDADGDFFTTFSLDDTINPSDLVTAMLSSGDLPSTEFSNCFAVPAGPVNTPPDAVPQEVSTPQNESLQIDLQGTDLDDDDLSFSIDSEPSSGTVEFGEIGTDCTSENSCTVPVFYTPSPGFTGTATFPFSVNDGTESSPPATVTIDVQAVPNTPPVAVETSAVAQENDSVVVQLEGSDADGDALTFDVQPASAQGGSVSSVSNTVCEVEGLACTAEVTYTAPANFVGPDSFTFTVDDGQDASPPATVTIDVQAVPNTPPVAQPGSFPVVSDGTSSGRVLYATDIDEDLLTFDITQQPLNGVVSGPNDVTCGPDVTFDGAWTCQQTWGYLATPGFEGTDSFEFTACDASEACDTATVTVTVTAPVAQADLALLTLTDSPDPVTAGGVVAYQATVKNLGPATATGVRVDFSDPESGSLPAGVTFVSGTVSSSAGGSGTCTQIEEGVPVSCTLGIGTVPASSLTTWTVTVYLQTSDVTASSIDVEARVQGDQEVSGVNNQLTESTTVEPFVDDSFTEFVPPSVVTETVATAETVLVGGQEVPIAQPGDTTAAAISVPPGGPGGVVTVAEFECEPPFCAAAARTTVPTPGTPPIDDRVIQFIPPFAPFYDYRKPVTYQIAYDASVVGGVRARSVRALYAKEDNPITESVDESQVLYQAAQCPRTLTSSTEFPCLKSAKVLKGKNPLLKGDLVLTLLGTYNDPKIAGFR